MEMAQHQASPYHNPGTRRGLINPWLFITKLCSFIVNTRVYSKVSLQRGRPHEFLPTENAVIGSFVVVHAVVLPQPAIFRKRLSAFAARVPLLHFARGSSKSGRRPRFRVVCGKDVIYNTNTMSPVSGAPEFTQNGI